MKKAKRILAFALMLDMLVALVDFSLGKLDAGVKEALKERMEFDAINGKGTLKKRAQQIVANVTD